MKLRMYTVYDRKALAYHQPYFAHNDAVAVRTLSDAVADPNSMFGRHPNDYVLYCCGIYDDANATIVPVAPVMHVMDAISLVRALQSEIPFPEDLTTARPSSSEFNKRLRDQDGTTYHANDGPEWERHSNGGDR